MASQNITDLVLPGNERALIAQAFMKSGLFSMGGTRDHPIPPDIQLARAYVKIQAGYEHGFQPFYSMQNFNIIQGRVQMSAQAVGAKIKESKRYDYAVKAHTDTECSIQFYKDGKAGYLSTFTIADAKRAGLHRADSGWTKYPRAMLFARSLTQGGNIECPEVLKGIITDEESEDKEYVDPETGEIKTVDSIDLLAAPQPEKGSAKEGSGAEDKPADKKKRKDKKAETDTMAQAADDNGEASDDRVDQQTEVDGKVDDKTSEKGLFEGQENKNEGEKNYPGDLPFDPSTIKDLSRFFKQIHVHCGISPTAVWPILGVINNPDLMEKYPILADAFIKVWDHYTISKSKS